MRPFFYSLFALSCLCLAGCISIDSMNPMQAVMAAAGQPDGVSGVFEFEVRGGGRQDGWLYVNSESDYRDQRCLTIAVPPHLARALEVKLLGDPVDLLKGHRLRVSGTARRTTIWLTVDGVKTEKYYYQTHVRLSDLSQLTVLR